MCQKISKHILCNLVTRKKENKNKIHMNALIHICTYKVILITHSFCEKKNMQKKTNTR